MTTILCVKRGQQTTMVGDGQVTQNDTILKATARKVRRLHNGKVIVGFAGATADAMTLLELFEAKLQDYSGKLLRSAVELAKEWRTDRRLRNLDALMLVADCDHMLLVTGVGDVVEPDDGVLAVGSGSRAATAAARALLANTDLDAEAIATKAMELAAQLDVYTNERWITETLTSQ